MKELMGMQTVINACMLLALQIHRLFSKQLHAVRLYSLGIFPISGQSW